MTAPNGPILFNSSTGSDSTSSGLGPSSAVIGSSAELNGTPIVDVSYDGMDLSGISAGDLLFCDTASGRKFSVIGAVDTLNETITTDDAWNTASGVSWAVGGKRASIAGSSMLLTNDGKYDSILELEDSYSETFSSFINILRAGLTLRGKLDAANKPVLTFTNSTESVKLGASSVTVQNIELQNTATNTSSTSAFTVSSYATLCRLIDVSVDHQTNNYYHCIKIHASGTTGIICDGCSFGYAADKGIFLSVAAYAQTSIRHCRIFNCQSHGFDNAYNNPFVFAFNLVYGNGGSGISRTNTFAYIVGNVFYDNTGDGVVLSGSNNQVVSNVFVGNAYGLSDDAPLDYSQFVNRNAFYNNTNGETNNLSPVIDSITLTADPFTDAANGDFSLNSDAGGGAALRAITSIIGSTTSYPFNWLTDGSGSGGGGGSTFHPLAQ